MARYRFYAPAETATDHQVDRDTQRPATPADLAALDALHQQGVDTDQLDAAHVGRLVRAEKARQARLGLDLLNNERKAS